MQLPAENLSSEKNPCPVPLPGADDSIHSMKTHFLFDGFPPRRYEDFQLWRLVDKLIKGMQPAAVRQNSFIINDIQPSIMVTADDNLLAAVTNDLLALIVSRNKNSCIRVSAKTFSNLVLLYLKDENKSAKEFSNSDLAELQPLAAKMGGCITICNLHKNSDILALSFLDYASVI
jgi:hypothetical protein